MVTHIIPIGFHSKHIYNPIKKYGCQRIIWVVTNPKDSYAKKKSDDALAQAKKIVGTLNINYEVISFKEDYSFEERVQTFSDMFEKENEVVVNLTGGPKFDSFVLYLVALKYPSKVKDIIYIREDIGELISFPKFVYSGSLTDFEVSIVQALKDGDFSPNELAKKLDKQVPQVLRYLKGLEERGIVISEKLGKERMVRLAYKMLI